MPRSGGAATLMQPDFKDLSAISYVSGSPEILNQITDARPMRPFSDIAVSFLGELSKQLITNRDFPDVATFGFWCRKQSLLSEKDKISEVEDRIGRGVVFHISPSNVAVNFAYSFAAGLLSGNANIVRLPSKPFAQVAIITDAVNRILETNEQTLRPYVCMIRYGSEHSLVTESLSAVCDVRVIWGGDQTISNIRKFPLPPDATEILFADRYSIALIDSDAYLAFDAKDRLAQDFYNDTYYSDQNACTSPRIVVWMGSGIEAAKAEFWARLHKIVEERYEMSAVQSVGKLHAAYKAAADRDIRIIKQADTRVSRIQVSKLDPDLMDYKYNSGFFFEYDAKELREIGPICGGKCQTLTYFGRNIDEFKRMISENRPKGIDRVVPIGKSMDFSLVWDGYDLIRSLSRRIVYF